MLDQVLPYWYILSIICLVALAIIWALWILGAAEEIKRDWERSKKKW